MARKNSNGEGPDHQVTDLRHDQAKRTAIPPAGLGAKRKLVKEERVKYGYNPHLPPILRFDPEGRADRLNELLEKLNSTKQLTDEEILELQALAKAEPWLEWSGKREQPECVVDPVALQVHERISAQAILKVAAREDVPRDLFSDPEQEYQDAVQYYEHKMDWTNRLILGDSLAVMSSLARREALAGQVQMIYMDPPYGIKYASNFQSEVGKQEVRDKDDDLTREPEMVKAYRDTWTLGVHSYLSYLRDRLLLAKELLADTGSIFVQISDENLHRVRSLLDEVFGPANAIAIIAFRTTTGKAGALIDSTFDYLVWYARDLSRVKYRQLYEQRTPVDDGNLRMIELLAGERRRLENLEVTAWDSLSTKGRIFRPNPLTSQSGSNTTTFQCSEQGGIFRPTKGGWKTNESGMERLSLSNRLLPVGQTLSFVRYLDDFPLKPSNDVWDDTRTSGFSDPKRYVVQTNTRVIERCLLMTTDPGDLVLDPTCGSGTTAYVAETWGRRWITIDTSRVAVAIARQRLLTSRFEHFKLRSLSAEDLARNPSGTWLTDPTKTIDGPCTFDCKTVPHITLKSIARNQALDPIFAKWDPQLKALVEKANAELAQVPAELHTKLRNKALDSLGERKAKSVGHDLDKLKRALSDADWRRWILPPKLNPTRNYTTVDNDFSGWYDWEMPFDTDPDWPQGLQDTVTAYRDTWKAKMNEVNDCIAARADQEELVDQPYRVPSVLRVSGPFTVEGVIPVEESIDLEVDPPVESPDASLETFDGQSPSHGDAWNADSYLDQMVTLLRKDGVRFPDNKVQQFAELSRVNSTTHHAEGLWVNGPTGTAERTVYVVIGPQYGPIIKDIVDDALARSRKADVVLFAGFSFASEAQDEILYRKEVYEEHIKKHPGSSDVQQVEMVQIRPDANPAMGGLLKNTVHQQLFTVSGTPRTKVEQNANGEFVATMEGVDIYDPITNTVRSSGADKVAAWFLDGDYDGKTFCVTQAFFPDRSAWDKIAKHLDKSGVVDMERFEAFSGTTSLPFPLGKNKRVAIKVIDPRGNEVMRVHRLGGYGE